jgi:HAE1 family hydrophobic/amphiphilic exporter-1
MIAGMTPVALQLLNGEQFRAAMAIAVTGGLVTSTALTLVIIPAVFTLVDDVEQWLGPRVARLLLPTRFDDPGKPDPPPHRPHVVS